MTHASRLRKNPHTFRRLTGLTPERFDALLTAVGPRYASWNRERLSRRKRQRRIGGGRLFELPLEDRLLLLLLYYRTYVSQAFLGFLVSLDDSTVSRNIRPLEPLLAGSFQIPERTVELYEDELLTIFFDGTEQQIERPSQKRKTYRSGQRKRFAIKHLVAVAKRKGKKEHLRIAAVTKAFPGSVQDSKIYKNQRIICPPGTTGMADLGFLGTSLTIPIRKPRGKPLSTEQKCKNRRHAKRRIVVEHGIGKMKIWKILSERYRNTRSRHSLIFKNVAGLSNLMFA